jgi:hypothetical protein
MSPVMTLSRHPVLLPMLLNYEASMLHRISQNVHHSELVYIHFYFIVIMTKYVISYLIFSFE